MSLSNVFKGFIVTVAVALFFSPANAENAIEKSDLAGQVCEADPPQPPPPEERSSCDAPDAPSDEIIARTAVRMCLTDATDSQKDSAYKNALILLSVERSMKVPEVMKGMTLAAACKESGFDKNAEGDHRFSKDGKTPKAIGILQLWPIYESAYKVNRRDVASSAKGWLKHIERQLTSVAKNCHTETLEDNWRIAWVTGVRAPKKGGRCKENVSHWKLFKKLRTEVENSSEDPRDQTDPWRKNET